MNAEAVRIRRKNAFNVFREGGTLASFDEFPMLRPEVDPQLHLSKNTVDQPFFLACQKDCVIAQVNGRARVEFLDGPVRYFDLAPGDFVYVPGGAIHRIATLEPGLQFRYKARDAGSEGVVWYCDQCGQEIDRHVWHTQSINSQAAYQLACERHNAEVPRRRCSNCGSDHPKIDLNHFRWKEIAEALMRGEDGE